MSHEAGVPGPSLYTDGTGLSKYSMYYIFYVLYILCFSLYNDASGLSLYSMRYIFCEFYQRELLTKVKGFSV